METVYRVSIRFVVRSDIRSVEVHHSPTVLACLLPLSASPPSLYAVRAAARNALIGKMLELAKMSFSSWINRPTSKSCRLLYRPHNRESLIQSSVRD